MGFMGKDCGEAAPILYVQKSLLFARLSLLLEAGVSVVQVLAGQPSLRPDGVLVGVVPGKVAWPASLRPDLGLCRRVVVFRCMTAPRCGTQHHAGPDISGWPAQEVSIGRGDEAA